MVVVDPHFQSQFSVVAPTARYNAALQIPEYFVGSLSRLANLVSFLCREMAASFQVTKFSLPPWRQRRAMLSKWQPLRARTYRVQPESSGGLQMSTHCTQKAISTDGAPISGRPILSVMHELQTVVKASDSKITRDKPAATQQVPFAATTICIESGRKYGREKSPLNMGTKDRCIGGNRCSFCEIWQQLTGEQMCGIFPPIRIVRMQGKPQA